VIAAAVIGDAAPLAIPLVGPGRAGALVLAAAFFVRGIGITGCNVHVYAIRQVLTPDHLRGRTLAAYQLLVAGVIPLGALVGGFLGGHLGLRPTLLLATLGLLSTSFWLIASPVRRLERPPTASAETGPPGEADRVTAA
jgi:MFS family permease